MVAEVNLRHLASRVMWCDVCHMDERMRGWDSSFVVSKVMFNGNGFDPMGFPHHQVPPFGRRVLGFPVAPSPAKKIGRIFHASDMFVDYRRVSKLLLWGSPWSSNNFSTCVFTRCGWDLWNCMFRSEKFTRIYSPEIQCIWYIFLYIYYKN